jgi:hypothetical protein
MDILLEADFCLSEAASCSETKISVMENYATGDAHQIIAITDQKTLHGKNQALGWRAKQIGGRMSDETVRQISRDMMTVTVRSVHDDEPPVRKGTPTGSADREWTDRQSEFHERYGEGFKLTST